MNIPSWAHAGAKVVCVDDNFVGQPAERLGCSLPVRGKTYTIRQITFVEGADVGPGVLLEEVANAYVEYPSGRFLWRGEPCFGLRRFRPVITIEDDLKAHFAHLLDAPVRVSEEA